MTHFTIDTENSITAHATAAEAKALEGAERFSNEAALAKLAAEWPAARLIEIYNSLTGVTPVTKFKDRKTAAARIWKGIQTLGQPVAAQEAEQPPVESEPAPETDSNEVAIPEQASEEVGEPAPATDQPAEVASEAPQPPDVAPEQAPAKKKPTRVKKTPAANEGSDGTAATTARVGSKTETVLALMKQAGGTTLKAIMEATQWQAHSVRGFISGTLGKKMGLTVVSTKGENGERTYSIQA